MRTGSTRLIFSVTLLGIASTQHPVHALEARIGYELSGTEMARAHTKSAGECEQQCRDLQGCTGYNFILDLTGGGIKLGAKTDPGGPLAGQREPIASCTFLTGQLQETPRQGIQSCRMPCKAGEPDPGTLNPTDGPKDHYKDEIGDKTLGTTAGPERLNKIDKFGDPAVKGQYAPAQKTDGNAVSPGTLKQRDPKAEKFSRPSPPEDGASTSTPPQQPQPPVQAATPPAVQKLSGYQIVRGPTISLQQLGVADAIAECPNGKIAISGGFVITALDPAVRFGLEIKGVMPDGANGPLVRAKFRNADIVQPATGHAIAICINGHPNVRNSDTANSDEAVCGNGEVVVGGGTMGNFAKHLNESAPVGSTKWRVSYKDPLLSNNTFQTRAVCAPQSAVVGWEFQQSPVIGLSARGVSTRQLRCSPGKVAIAPGFHSSNPIGLEPWIGALNGTLEPGDADGGVWTSELRNRDVLGAPDSVIGKMVGICASIQ